MADCNDWQLLRRFVEQNSQEAFATLSTRYLNLVYSVCRRETADAETAEDVTQAVFLILARKAPTLRRGVVLSGWLFQTARFAAKNARLQAQRRAAYEQKAAEEMEQQSEEREDAAWAEIEPILNQSLASLQAGERECVLLRFFQGLSFAEAGAMLGLSEEAARKRVTRALEKMRRFFSKEGVIIPGAALAVLLSAHAAKAAPATCQASIAHVSAGVAAGHLSVGMTSSHVYQISEGVLKAMKIAQIKIAASLTATMVVGIGLATYAVVPLVTHAHQISPLLPTPKPGHVLAQVPGKTLTAPQIAARSREAYASLESYQGTTTVTSQDLNAHFPMVREYHTSANIQFVRPGKIHVEGKDSDGDALAYVSDGSQTVETFLGLNHWKKEQNTETAVGGVTGIGLSAPTTIPAALLGINWGNPLPPGRRFDPEVREDNVNGQPCYVLTARAATAARAMTQTLWIDEKTHLLRRSSSDSDGVLQIPAVAGQSPHSVSVRYHDDQRFTNERLNETIPESAFALPSVQ